MSDSQPQTTKVTIRAASAEDAARLSLISDATFLETFAGQISGEALVAHCREKHAPAYLTKLIDQGAKAWLAELDGSPVGYALLTAPELEAARDDDIELKKIYVLSRFHGSGIAARLFDAVLASCSAYPRLLLGVKADNDRAIAFYTKNAFNPIGTRQFNVGGKLYDDLVLARDLHAEMTP